MSKFNFDEWKGKEVVMHCKTEEEAKDFCRVMHDAGRKWVSGETYEKNTFWEAYTIDTCYAFNANQYSGREYFKEEGYTILEWSDYTEKKPFTKPDLRSGDVCVQRDGLVMICCVETDALVSQDGYNRLSSYNNELKWGYSEMYDIIDVYRPKEPKHCQFKANAFTQGEHVYHREEQPIEITLDEIAKLKGVPVERIKIIK